MSLTHESDASDQTILVLAPLRQDAPTVASVLARAGIATRICRTMAELCGAMDEGAGAALIAEEVLNGRGSADSLLECLGRQPPWSELPIVVVTSAAHGRLGADCRFERFSGFPTLMYLERPLRSATLVSAMRSALQARQRQYQLRDHLRERERVEERLRAQEQELRRLNQTLEERVHERTAELEHANRRLLAEIEQRENAERALHQAQKMEAIGQLTGGIAHDFNNLLMVVSGGLDMLERATDPARREKILTGMRQAAARGEALTGQLLAFSRRMTLNPEPIDLRAQLDGMQILVAGALREDIRIEIALPEALWPVMADATQLELAILNLAVNARDAMPSGGMLTIEARNEALAGGEAGLMGDFVRIEVRDTGTGIPPHVLDRVFDPFFTTKPVGKGTGLGLSQIYGFAKQSGGHVEIQSRVGEGTRVVLYLPRAMPGMEAAEMGPDGSGARVALAGARRRVLLVEDNDAVAAMTAQMLEELGMTVRRVPDARSALREFENGKPVDLVFSDIVMPGGMNGIELARELRRRNRILPIVLTTGYIDDPGDRDGLDGFPLLTKPYRLENLQAVLERMCGA